MLTVMNIEEPLTPSFRDFLELLQMFRNYVSIALWQEIAFPWIFTRKMKQFDSESVYPLSLSVQYRPLCLSAMWVVSLGHRTGEFLLYLMG